MSKFNPEHKIVLDEMLLGLSNVREGKMFGYPAYYAGKKLCLSLYEQGVGVKLPEATVEILVREDPAVIPFQPLGRPRMREWAQINVERSKDFRKYQAVFEESIRFVLELQGISFDK